MEGIKATDIKDFQAEVFCITGKVDGWSRGELWGQITARDGEYTERITRETTVCVYGSNAGEKLGKARERGIRLMGQTEFLKLLAATPVVGEWKGMRSIIRDTNWRSMEIVEMIRGQEQTTESVSEDLKPETMKLETTESVSSSEAVTSPLTSEPKAVTSTSAFSWRELVSGIAAILIILVKGLAVVCGLSICVCLWLVGIPARP